MSETVSEQGKTRAIIAHITLIGWIIALVQNNSETKDEFASFYIRQMLGLICISIGLAIVGAIIGMIIPILGQLLPLGAIAFWVMSLISATQGEKKPLPVVGDMFQDWFKTM